MHGASGIEVEVRLRTLMTHVTAYGVEWKRRYGLQGSFFNASLHGQRYFFDNNMVRAQDVWLKGHRCEERAAIFLQLLALQAQSDITSLPKPCIVPDARC